MSKKISGWFGVTLFAVVSLHCGSLDESGSSGSSTSINLTIQNPDSSASGTAKAVDVGPDGNVSKALPSSADVTSCTITASGPSSASKTVAIPSGASTVKTVLDISTTGSGYQICAECLDSACASNNVSCGYKGCAKNVTIAGSDSVSINALFLNLASRSTGNVRYVRFRQDNKTQMKIVVGGFPSLTDENKTAAQCNLEIDNAGTATSPATVDASRSDGFVSGAKGRPYFILGPGLITPSCHRYNTSGVKQLDGTGSWSTDSSNITTLECSFGVRQGEQFCTGRKCRFAIACSANGSEWFAIPTSGMAEIDTSPGGDEDIASLVADNATCSISRNGETCSSGRCTGRSLCAPIPAPTLANDVTDFAGPAGTGSGSADGAATDATFNGPRGLCIAPDGEYLFIADTANETIRRVNLSLATTSSSFVTTFAGSAGSTGSTNGTCGAARFDKPRHCVVASTSDAIYVTEVGNDTIRKITYSGTTCGAVSLFAGTSGTAGFTNGTGTGASFNNPLGLDIDTNGTLYVADEGNNAIRKVTSGAVVTTFAGGCQGSTNGVGTNACFNNPGDVAAERTGSFLYVADRSNGLIRRVNIATQGVTTFVTDQTGVTGVAVDSATLTNLYAVVSGGAINKIIISTAGSTLIAGSTSATGATNGNGTTARFNNATDLTISPTGTSISIADTDNNKIRSLQ